MKSQIHIEILMAEAGSGATGILLGQRPNGEFHVFNVTNLNGKTYFIDGQTGRFANPSNFKNLSLLRTDI